jgi:hypothetical protein
MCSDEIVQGCTVDGIGLYSFVRFLAKSGKASPAPKIFFAKTSFTIKGVAFVRQNHFWAGFWERGHE